MNPLSGQDCIRPTFANNTARNAIQIGIVRNCESFLGDETPHVNRKVILATEVEFVGLASTPPDCDDTDFIFYRILIKDALPLNEDFPQNDVIDITESTSVTVPLLPGDYEVSIFAVSDLDAPVFLKSNSIDFTLEVKASENPYQQPIIPRLV